MKKVIGFRGCEISINSLTTKNSEVRYVHPINARGRVIVHDGIENGLVLKETGSDREDLGGGG